ncbi:MAG: hypothetical protein HN816_12300, partial [Gammaproteobacteria bacterium]|nr:hypothetical protein [Gammaproteobacteria bacterium]
LARYLVINPDDTDTLYLSTGIFDIEANNSDCDAGLIGGEGILKSTDGGTSWTAVNQGIEDLYLGSLRMHPTNPEILFAGAVGVDACQGTASGGGGLYRTENAGSSWQRVEPALMNGPISAVNFSPSNPSVIFAAFENAVYHSTDGGETWSVYTKDGSRGYGPLGINAGIPIDLIVDPDDPEVVFANNYGGGLFRSEDSGQNWTDASNGFSGAVIYEIATLPGKGTGVIAAAKSGVFKSNEYGNGWSGLARGDAGSIFEGAAVAAHPGSASIIMQSAQYNGELYRSMNGGKDFDLVYTHPGDEHQISHIVFAPSNPEIVYAGVTVSRGFEAADGPVILKSTDGGKSFSELSVGTLLDARYVRDLTVHPTDEDTLYIASSDPDVGDDDLLGAVIRSTDGGEVFNEVLANGNFGAIDVDATGTVIAGALWGANSAGIYRSTDGGATWSGPFTTGLGFEPFITDIVRHPTDGRLFAAELYSGIYVSADEGNTWDEFPSGLAGLENRAVNALAINDRVIYAGTQGGGVFRYALGPLYTATDYLQTTSSAANITSLHIVNSSSAAQSFTATLYAGSGEQLGTASQSLSISPVSTNERLVLSSADIETVFDVEAWSGPAMLEVTGEANFQLLAKLRSPSGLVSNTNCVTGDRVLNIEGFDSPNKTFVRFINTSGSDIASIKGTLYDIDGEVIGQENTELFSLLAAKAQVWINRDNLASLVGSEWNGEAMLEVVGQEGLKLLNLNFVNEETFFNFSCFENSDSATTYLQTTSSSANVSLTHLVNTSDTAQQFSGTLYSGTGERLGSANQFLHEGLIPPKGRLIVSSSYLESVFGVTPWSGPAVFEVSGTDTFELMTKLQSPSGLISNTNCVRQDQVHNIEGFDSSDLTFVRFINSGTVDLNNIKGTLYDSDGAVIGSASQTLHSTLAAKSQVWLNRNTLSDLVGGTWNGEATLKIEAPPDALRLLNLNFINSETFFNFSCYEATD